MKKLIFLIFILINCIAYSQVQKNNKSALTIEKIMQDPAKWIGTSPSSISWSDDSKTIFFNWNPDKDTLESLHKYSLKEKSIVQVPIKEKTGLPGRSKNYNSDKTKMVYTKNGNLVLVDLKKQNETLLADLIGRISQPRFVNEKTISFMNQQNLFRIDIDSKLITQVTEFTTTKDKDKKEIMGQDKWLSDQQLELFDVLNERKQLKEARENQSESEKIEKNREIYVGKNRVNDASLSPSEKYIVYSTYQNPKGAVSTAVFHYVTETGYSEDQKTRTKVGSPQGIVEMGIFDCENNKNYTVKTSGLPGIKDLPDYVKDYPNKMPAEDAEIPDREVNMMGPIWNNSKDLAIVVALSHDNKDRWILLLDPKTGKPELLDRQRDEAWIGGPGIGGWNFSTGDIGWMPDGNSIWFQSEESGYSHIYTLNVTTRLKKALTSGNFEVYSPRISKDKKSFYFTANKVHPGVRHFYRMPITGGEMVQLTSMEGNNDVTLSPDEKNLAVLYSSANQPWELYVQENKPGAKARKVTNSITEDFAAYPWRTPKYVTFNAEDGAEVNARLYQPETPQKQGPAVIFVHGAGYLQNAHKWWSSYFREYQFHNFLVDNGYTVIDIDYRGSAGYGRDWRTGIYRFMGGKDLSDQVDAAKFLAEKYDVSPNRIGLYGGSYGGFITLMAMFNNPDVFAAGAALRSVTDWAHYNHGYTANILNTPVEDSLAYVKSSPIYFAEGLKGNLLMCHGMVDDNVHFQDIVRLSQRLIELGKENWELAIYPVEQHGFREPSSWTDEYKRIFKLFEENLKK